MTLSVAEVFEGRKWVLLAGVSPSGEISPAPKTPVEDILGARHAYKSVGPGVYNVINYTKGYCCFVQFKRGEMGQKYARCDHENCLWQSKTARPKPCKHIRAACRWHVKLIGKFNAFERIRGSGRTLQTEVLMKYADNEKCPNCGEGRLRRCEHGSDWEPSEGQRWYFEFWYKCSTCFNIFHVEQAKRAVEGYRRLSA